MPVSKVSEIHIYPIKSTAGISLPQAKVEKKGLAFDRRFVLCDPNGQFITARTEPKLCLVKTTLFKQGITLSAPNMKSLTLTYSEFGEQYSNVNIWGDEVAGQVCSSNTNQWVSEYLKRPCSLLFFGTNSTREKKPNTDQAREVAFADGYPLLLISQGSLDDLNNKLESNNLSKVSMAQFRPNIVVDNCLAFEEDTWQHIRIGEVEFTVSKPCERCIFTTVSPETGEKHPQQQPLQTLSSYRKTHDGEVMFGQNLIALNTGVIKQGDKLTVLNKQQPPVFNAVEPSNKISINSPIEVQEKSSMSESVNNKLTVTFEKWKKTYLIPPQSQRGEADSKTILEHGEDAGLILPYSCRAGMCGRCKAKLISGEVSPLSIDSLDGLTAQEKEQGYILCCSTIAKSNIVIKHT